MKNTMKHKYVPCQLDVVEFKVERGYATSPAESGIFTWQGENNMLWSMSDQQGEYKNERYEEQIWYWADSQNNLPSSI